MKIEIQKHTLKAALDAAKPLAVGQLPVTSNVQLNADNDRLMVAVDNLEQSLIQTMACQGIQRGGIGLPARKLAAIIATLPDDAVMIETDTRNVASIQAGTSRIKLHGLDVLEFPATIQATDGQEYSLDAEELTNTLKRVAPAMCKDESRWILCGISAEFGVKSLRLTASDGRRLVRDSVACVGAMASTVVINRTAIEYLVSAGRKGVLKIRVGESMVTFSSDGWQYTVRRSEGVYPSVDKAIPTTFDGQAALPRKSFLEALDRVALIGTESVRIQFEPGQVNLSATAADVGSASESVACQHNANDYAVTLNPEYLRVAFATLSQDEILMDLGRGGTEASVLRNGTNYLHAVMPMRK